MAKEYKFMFDRRFDEPEEEAPSAPEDLSAKSVDGIPSISQLLDTINEQIAENSETLSSDNENEPPQSAPDAVEPPAAEPDGTPAEETESVPSPVEELQATVQAAQEALEQAVKPVFTQDEMDAAKAAAREDGYRQGLEDGRAAAWQEAMQSVEKQTSDTLNVIANSVKELLARSQNDSQAAFAAAVDFAMAVCRKAVPALSERHATGEIAALLEKNFRFLKDEPKISLRLNPQLADRIKPMLAALVKRESFGGQIAVVRDDSLPVGDCRIEWKNGGLERKTQDVLNQTEELLKLYAQAAPSNNALSTGE